MNKILKKAKVWQILSMAAMVGILGLFVTSAAYADNNISDVANVNITANNDGTNDGQGVYIKSNAAAGALGNTKASMTLWAPLDGGGVIDAQAATNIIITGNSDGISSGNEGVILQNGSGLATAGKVEVLDTGVYSNAF